MSRIQSIEIRHLDLPLIKPYALSYRTFESFEPYLVTIATDEGQKAVGEQHISPGSSSETREGGWSFLTSSARELIGSNIDEAFNYLDQKKSDSPVAAAAALNALDQLKAPGHWVPKDHLRIPVLSAFSAITRESIQHELDEKLELGFRTFKIKVGKDVTADVERVRIIQDTLGQDGTIRVDANRAYSVPDAIELSQVLDQRRAALLNRIRGRELCSALMARLIRLRRSWGALLMACRLSHDLLLGPVSPCLSVTQARR